jgi:hypothetical protein
MAQQRVFNALDATLFSQTISGNITASNDGSPTVASLVSLLALGSWDFFFDLNGTMLAGFASIQGTGGITKIEQLIDIDYTKVLTGLPEGAKIKKMVINTPYTINVDIETDANFSAISLSASGSITTIVNGISNNISPGIVSGNTATPGQPPDGTDYLIAGIATPGSAEADHIVFDLTGGDLFVSLDDFVDDYNRITFRDNIFMNSIVNDAFGATNVDAIYSSSLANTWKITVTYEDSLASWLLNPKAIIPDNPLLSPSTQLITITDAGGDLDQFDDLFAYYVVDGIPSAAFPIINFITRTNSLIIFTLPSFAIPSGTTIFVAGTGTTFSGYIPLGFIYTILVDGSGLYKLNFDKNYDTYYDRNTDPVETVNMTIPSPFGRTGFF